MENRIAFFSASGLLLMLLILTCCKRSEKGKAEDIITDIDGNKYHTLTLGTQVWMVENLNVIRFQNGDLIPNVIEDAHWEKSIEAAYSYYQNNKKNGKVYGKLYNWHTISDSRGLCPPGWHVPSDEEWQILSDFLGGNEVAGNLMKESGFKHWKMPNEGATNSSGFSALPAGGRDEYGKFFTDSFGGHWWSATEDGTIDVWVRSIYYEYGSILRDSYHKNSGFSIRCIKD